MDLGTYMSMALGHPEYGYYISHDPLGKEGDFTTAPEISQMFGELIGAWVADCWMQAGMPNPFAFVEFGPGRGTLMADALRVCSKVPGFYDALSVHLVESSPVLKDKQKQALANFKPVWHDSIESLPVDVPLYCIGNEFLDALPVRQYQKSDGSWFERVIGINDNGDDLSVGLGANIPDEALTDVLKNGIEGAVYEFAPVREQFVSSLSERIKKQGGCALFIDYGYSKDECGDTLQAVQSHKRCDILHEPGNADITAHVDFSSIERISVEQGLTYHGTAFQGAFLMQLGINERAQVLQANANDDQKRDILSALDRLTASKHMGNLFKVCAITSGDKVTPAGFI